MKAFHIFIILFMVCLSTIVKAQSSTEDSLKTAFIQAKADSVAREQLELLANFYMADSATSPQECYNRLQKIIKQKGNPNLDYMLLRYYVDFLHTSDSTVSSRVYLYKYLEQCRINNQWKEFATILMRLAYYESYLSNYKQSFKLLLTALDFARDTLKDKEMVGGVLLSLGIYYYDQKDTLKAIEYNKWALNEMTEINLISNMASVSNNLALQYTALKQYDSAEFYFRESIRLFHQSIEEPNLRVPLINLAEVFRLTNNYDSALFYTNNAVRNAKKINDEESLASAYWQLAKTYQDIGKSDSTEKYFQLAKEYFESSLPEAAGILFYPDLAAFYVSKGNYKSAYEYLQKTINIKDLLFNETNNKILKEMDVKYEASQKEKEILKQEEQIKRQRILSYSMIAIAVFFLLLIFFVYRGFRLKQKANIIITHEKNRSEELLLNILPSEVAEELKSKGSAEAKLFDDVTVMFTDFKNFTQISEKLSPKELVAEIHTCFKAFDQIIGKHNIEKIKTIGDSYMCAGGLPVANKTNAVDAVNAAIDIQHFMQLHRQERIAEGKEVFDIRIGIHTGPVVAGIVGVKKFAYDIWGDTVNIASRMESSGEAGKVNISGSTYALVKDKFDCIHRGKVQAKNKGEIDMFFVQRSLSVG